MLRRTAGWALGAGVVVGAGLAYLAELLVPSAGVGSLVAVGLVGAIVLIVQVMGVGILLHEVRESVRGTQMLVNIRPLMGALPLPVGGWAMEADLGNLLAQTIQDRRPRLMVECGAGSSTVLAAEVLQRLGTGRIISLEHEPGFAEQTRARLRERGLESRAEVITAPLVPRDVDGRTQLWYDIDVASQIPDEIDLLLVDGPPRRTSELARYPAIPLLRHRLAAGCVVILDDGNRPDERQIGRAWGKLLSTPAHHSAVGKGAWILKVPPT
jgi:predicted O-methyltransferase YrrM